MAAVTVGAALPLVDLSLAMMLLSAALFGCAFLAVVAAVSAVARQIAPPNVWTAAIGGLTIAVSIGQSLGPVLVGVLSDGSGWLKTGLAISACILVFGTICAAFQREPDESRSRRLRAE